MIEKSYVFPECYIIKIPKCDFCENETLYQVDHLQEGYVTILKMKCPKCGNIYNMKEDDLRGEWKWRVM